MEPVVHCYSNAPVSYSLGSLVLIQCIIPVYSLFCSSAEEQFHWQSQGKVQLPDEAYTYFYIVSLWLVSLWTLEKDW